MSYFLCDSKTERYPGFTQQMSDMTNGNKNDFFFSFNCLTFWEPTFLNKVTLNFHQMKWIPFDQVTYFTLHSIYHYLKAIPPIPARQLKFKSQNLMLLTGALSHFFNFFQTFRDLGITRKLIFFSQPMSNFTAEICSVWKILMKMCLVMVTIIKLTHTENPEWIIWLIWAIVCHFTDKKDSFVTHFWVILSVYWPTMAQMGQMIHSGFSVQ